jgi:hypothetical protein
MAHMRKGLLVFLVLLECSFFLTGCSRALLNSAGRGPALAATPNAAISPANTATKSLIGPPQATDKLPAPRLEVTKEVRQELASFLRGNGYFVRECLARRDKDYPLMVKIFEDEGVPQELLNLALIESGYRREARSHAGAVGMWQFMSQTARQYGLKVEGSQRDQRSDLIHSTLAAARHLKDLFLQHQDWYLALAAYNAGSGAVLRALNSTGSSSFWEVARAGKLANQTAHFVPRFIAATILVKAVEKFGTDNLNQRVLALLAPPTGTKPGEMYALNFEDFSATAISDWPGAGHPSAG